MKLNHRTVPNGIKIDRKQGIRKGVRINLAKGRKKETKPNSKRRKKQGMANKPETG